MASERAKLSKLIIFTCIYVHLFIPSIIYACPCDLTVGACDANCCCDTECHHRDVNFTFVCQPGSTERTLDDKLCVKKNLFFNVQNSKESFNDTDDPSIFCIYYDNYARRNYYEEVEKAEGIFDISNLINTYSKFSYQPAIVEPKNKTDFYKSGDPLYVTYPGVLGFLRLPKALNSQTCSRYAPVGYLDSTSSTCTVPIKDLEKECVQWSALDTQLYMNGFKVLKSPAPVNSLNLTNYFVDISDIDALKGLYQDSADALIIEAGKMTNKKGSLEYVKNDGICKNAVTKVTYIIQHKGIDGIDKITADFTFSDITPKQLPLSQTFAVQFNRVSGSRARQTSGNPGYVVGQPMIVGTLKDGSIEVANRPDRDWLVLLKPSANQDCYLKPNSARTHTVQFGENIRTGCLIRVSQHNSTQQCQQYHQRIMNIFNYNFKQTGANLEDLYVSEYGSSSTARNEWVIITKNNPPDAKQTCDSMTLGINYKFLYAKTGSLANPQPKIVGAMIDYDNKQKINLECKGTFCKTTSAQHFEVIQTVTFIDVSKPAVGVTGEPPIFYAKLPHDFFYPFLTSSSWTFVVDFYLLFIVVVFVMIVKT